MTDTIVAKYFDGQSSASRHTTIVYDHAMNEFVLNIENNTSFAWQIKDLQFEQYGSLTEIRNKNFPSAILKIDDEKFAQAFYQAMNQHKGIDLHKRLLNIGLLQMIFIAICLFGLVVLSYFYILPPIAEKSVALLPDGFDNQIGNIFMEAYLKDNDIDSVKTKYLEEFATHIDFNNHKPLHYAVVNSDEVNAFALPNGQIVVFSAILENMKSSDELVALLAHEASHINQRHSTKMICRNLAGYMIISLILSDVNGIMAVIGDNAQQLHSLAYSRKFEQEADEQGMKILMENNINPYGMVQLFEQLEAESGFDIPKIISSHPLTKDRKENMENIICEKNYAIKPNNQLDTIFGYLNH